MCPQVDLTAATNAGDRNLNDMLYAIKELRALKVSVVTGAAIYTDIAISGIATEDTIVGVVAIDGDLPGAGSVLNLGPECLITADGKIQFTTTNTTAFRIVLLWLDKTGQ